MAVDTEQYADLVAGLYEAAAVPDLWPNAIGRLSRIAGCYGGSIFTQNEHGTNWVSSAEIRPFLLQMVQDGWMEKNDRLAGLLEHPRSGFVSDLDVFTEDQIDAMPIYRDALRPAGLGWGAATTVRSPTGDVVVVSLERRFADGAVSPRELAALDSLRPHLARAALLGSQLQFQRAQSMLDALSSLGVPGAVVTLNGRLAAANSAFERLTGQIATGLRDRLVLRDRKANALLANSLSELSTDREGALRSIPVPASDKHEACIVHVVPIRRQAHDILGQAGALLVIAHWSNHEVRSGLLSGLYDLTPVEAAVAARLLEGLTVAGIAVERNVSVETVRTHLKRVLHKTGSTSQVDFVRKLSRLVSLTP